MMYQLLVASEHFYFGMEVEKNDIFRDLWIEVITCFFRPHCFIRKSYLCLKSLEFFR